LRARGQLALDLKRAGVGCGLCQCGICYRLRMLLAHLSQPGLCAAHAGLLDAASQQRTGHGTGCQVGPPWDDVESHGCAPVKISSKCATPKAPSQNISHTM